MAQAKKDEKEKLAPIVIKRVIKGGGGHHGGAWKVAYADFVTAMMAFFLLLWLLNVTTDEQKNAISNYFDPSHPKVSDVVSGAGGILGGMTVSPIGAMVSDVQPLVQVEQRVTDTHGEADGNKSTIGQESDEALQQEIRKREDERFQKAADQLKAEIASSADLKDLQKNLLIDITPEGLRIQIVDDQGRSMFPSGSSVMYEFMRQLLLKVSGVIKPLPNQVSVRGHTDSNKYKDPSNYDNWNLSADRAQASRRVLVQGGLPETRIEDVMGRADREPLEKDPTAARNRRITIILLRGRPTKEALDKIKAENAKAAAAKKAAQDAAKDQGGSSGIQIIDDTQPQSPANASGGAKPGAAKDKAKPEYNQPLPSTPLPTMPSSSSIQRQPQVLDFGGDAAPEDKSDSLYNGPTQSPYAQPQVGPPIIHKKLFDFGDDDSDAPAPAQPAAPDAAPAPAPSAPAPANAPASGSGTKTLQFGDAVPEQAAPTGSAALPPAPDTQINNAPAKTLEFGGHAAPAQPTAVPAPASGTPEKEPETDTGQTLEF